jgi:hypothetical protein
MRGINNLPFTFIQIYTTSAVFVIVCDKTVMFLVPEMGRDHEIRRADVIFVAKTVAVGGGAFEHIGDGFDTAVRMIGEAADGAFERLVEGEVVEEVAGLGSEGAKQTHTCAFDGGLWFDNLGDSS